MSTSHPQSLSASPILVPLDGSVRAESALPIARHLAECLDTPLLLTRVVDPLPASFGVQYASMPSDTFYPNTTLPPEIYQTILNQERQQAHTYLQAQAKALAAGGLAVRSVVAEGDAASALLDICTEKLVGMVVMTTHGRTGLARFALGSVADRLVRYSHVPVLLRRSLGDSPDSSASETEAARQLEHALVPLDGSEFAEAALPVVAELAGAKAIRQVTLLRVLPFSADEPLQSDARSYLETQAAELRTRVASQDFQVFTFLREGTAPSEKIIDQADAEQCLVVMATHGRGGLKRLVLGSVADQIVRTGQMPVLLIRPQNDATTPS